MAANTQDSKELEELFESIAFMRDVQPAAAPQTVAGDSDAAANIAPVDHGDVVAQIGRLTRLLHDALVELGLNKEIEKAVSTIPDARDRLNYVAAMTQKAADRVLNATDTAKPIVEKVAKDCGALSVKWQMLFEGKLTPEQFRYLVLQTRQFFDETPAQAATVNAQLTEIMMAQDFQDLTGQVIKKIIEINRNIEQQLVQLLLDSAPSEVRSEFAAHSTPGGPVIDPEGRTDVVTNQVQVDDLLASLGF